MRVCVDKNQPQSSECAIIKTGSFSGSSSFFKHIKSLKDLALASYFKVSEGIYFVIKTENSTTLKDLVRKLEKEGFIESFVEFSSYNDYPATIGVNIHHYLGGNDHRVTQKSSGFVFVEDGKDLAISKALGEALERHSSRYILGGNKNYYPNIRIGNVANLYKYLPKFTKNQIHRNNKLASSQTDLECVGVVKAKSLLSGKTTRLPSDFLYWGESFNDKQKLFFNRTTNGCGGGLTYESSVISAICENIERDHFLLHWFSGVHPKIIKNSSIDAEFRDYIIDVEENYGVEVYFLDIRYDTGVPVCVCVTIDPALKLISMGAKCSFSGIETLKHSFLEALLGLAAIRNGEVYSENYLKKILNKPPFSVNLTREDRIKLYCSDFGIEKIKSSFLMGDSINFNEYNKRSTVFKNKKDELDSLVNNLKDLYEKKGEGYDVFIHKFDSHWLRMTDYHSVKIFVPEFLKLHLNEIYATPVSERLIQFAKTKDKIIKSEEDINFLPHFFP